VDVLRLTVNYADPREDSHKIKTTQTQNKTKTLENEKAQARAQLNKKMTPQTPITVGHVGWSPDYKNPKISPATEGLMDRRSAADGTIRELATAIRERNEAREQRDRMRLELENLRQYVNELEIVRKQRDEAVHLASEAVKLAR
jgi:hypothetical protein